MPDLLIHRCTVRVVRRGGWSWGPDPKRFLDQVMRCFPEVLARKLASFLTDDLEREISAPVRIRIPMRLTDFMPDVPAAFRSSSDATTRVSFEQRVESALRLALGREPPELEPIPVKERFAADPAFSESASQDFATPGGALRRLLWWWHSEGTLENHLAEMSDYDVETSHEALLRHSREGDSDNELNAQHSPQQIEEYLNQLPAALTFVTRVDCLRRRIALAIQLSAELKIAIHDERLVQALDLALPLERPHPEEQIAQLEADAAVVDKEIFPSLAITVETKTRPEATRYAVPRSNPRSSWEVEVECALPFLLLGPLSRLGYFEVVAAMLEAAHLESDAHLFAALLAYKVLDPPQRGWLRIPESRIAAATFAGLKDVAEENTLVAFSHKIAPHTGVLSSFAAGTVIRGHAQGSPVVICRADTKDSAGFLLLDIDGCFPIARDHDFKTLLPVLRKLNSPVLVSREAAGPRLLGELQNAGLTFITEVPPIRHEEWRRIQQGPVVLGWTNHSGPHSEAVLRAAGALGMASQEANGLWQTFAIERPAAVRSHSEQLDHALVLSSAIGCGTLAWKLWQTRGRATPTLALQRFADLGAHVRFNSVSVLVRLPLGRRHKELSEQGLLAPVRNVPWLAGRRVEFGGG